MRDTGRTGVRRPPGVAGSLLRAVGVAGCLGQFDEPSAVAVVAVEQVGRRPSVDFGVRVPEPCDGLVGVERVGEHAGGLGEGDGADGVARGGLLAGEPASEGVAEVACPVLDGFAAVSGRCAVELAGGGAEQPSGASADPAVVGGDPAGEVV